MKNIIGIYHVNNTDYIAFTNQVIENVRSLQSDGQEVEVQYNTNFYQVGEQLVYNALILGRK